MTGAELRGVRDEFEALRARVSRAASEREELSERLDADAARLAALEGERAKLEAERERLEGERERLEGERATLEGELESARGRGAEVERGRDALRSDLDAAREERDALAAGSSPRPRRRPSRRSCRCSRHRAPRRSSEPA